ncbi:MAG: cysteine desulfurase [bacterium]|nr:cysteine desulfurase [bacterium]
MKLRHRFPFFANNSCIYFDSAASTQKLDSVIDKLNEFYSKYYSNIHRGIYSIAEEAERMYEETRKKIAEFINARKDEVIFTKNSTEALNIAINGIGWLIPEGSKVLLTILEHHANIVPWFILKNKKNICIDFVEVDENLNLVDLDSKLDGTKVFCINFVSNSLGKRQAVEDYIKRAKAFDAITIVDATQAVTSYKIDVKKLGCDFLAFSGHKMFGPSGVGVLYGKKELLERIEPLIGGGDMIKKVSRSGYIPNDVPYKFEAGTPPIAEVVALKEAVEFIERTGQDRIHKYTVSLRKRAVEILKNYPVEIYNDNDEHGVGVLSFNIKNVHPHDVGSIFAASGICVRAGHHCNQPLMDFLKIPGTVRISFQVYNILEEVDVLDSVVKKVVEVFR